jgi:NADH pyrophosphatase NudC (nudix superfamily)
MSCEDYEPEDCLPAWEEMDPLQQAALEASCNVFMDEDRAHEFCPQCGKAYEDFSDLGCGYCDARHRDFGVMP